MLSLRTKHNQSLLAAAVLSLLALFYLVQVTRRAGYEHTKLVGAVSGYLPVFAADSTATEQYKHVPLNHTYSKTLVVASTTHGDTQWARDLPEGINKAIYVADDPKAPLHPPMNKGSETMMYLTYIIDHYYNLSDVTIFTHGSRTAWHNNHIQDDDLVKMVTSLSAAHVQRVGYFNLLCQNEGECPDQIKPYSKEDTPWKAEQQHFLGAWNELFPNGPEAPETLATACCAQFAASRDAIEAVPLDNWVDYRNWVIETKHESAVSGRIWEYLWHFLLTGEAVVCPSAQYCYCDGYGICFNDDAEVMSYMAMKAVGQVAEEVAKELEVDKLDGGPFSYVRDHRIGRSLGRWLHEAEARGRDPKLRAELTGRGGQWREGDGY